MVNVMDIEKDWQSNTSLAESNGILLDNEIATDVTFVFPGSNHRVQAHKLILMSRSHVFYVMFTSDLQEHKEEIEITDIEMEIFKQFLRFLYCEDAMLSGENVLHLMYAAEKYEVISLKRRCLEYLESNIDQTNVWPILDQAIFYKEDKLAEKCLEFLSFNRSIEGIQEYHLSKETLATLVEFERLNVDEVTVFKACYKWANDECEKLDIEVNRENRREVLGSILEKIHFCSMTQGQFAREVSNGELLTPEEELAVFRFLCGNNHGNPPFDKFARILHQVVLPGQLVQYGFTFGGFNIQNQRFNISVKSKRHFKILGLRFSTAGVFNIRFNRSVSEKMIVTQAGEQKYLSKPVDCEPNRGLTICEETVNEEIFAPKHSVSFSYMKNFCFDIDRSGIIPPPFDALLLAL